MFVTISTYDTQVPYNIFAMFLKDKFPKKYSHNNSYTLTMCLGVNYIEKQ